MKTRLLTALQRVLPLLLLPFLALPVRAAEVPAAAPAASTADAELARLLQRKGDAKKGKEAYVICRGCHKADAAGRDQAECPPQLAGQLAPVLIKQMLDVRSGRRESPHMHPFITPDVLTSNQLADIAAYLSRLPMPAANGKGPGKDLDLGQYLYQRDCASCHGKRGEGDARRYAPRLAGQHYAYLLRQGREIRDQARRNADPEMVRLIHHYTDTDLEAVSDYLARLRVAGKAGKGR